MNYYDTLGVPADASPEQIKTAYRALVQLFHPDRLGHLRPEVRAFAEERLKGLNQAYEVLGDPERRAAYDAQHRRAAPAAPPPARPDAVAPPAAPAAVDWTRTEPRLLALDRQLRRARLEEQIIQLDRSLRNLRAERDRTHVELNGEHARTGRRFWLVTLLSGAGFWGLMLAALGVFSLPPERLSAPGQIGLFGLLVALYEYAVALALNAVTRAPGVPARPLAVAWVAAKAALVAVVVGVGAWAAWRLTLGDVYSLAGLLVLAAIFFVAHVVYCWLALGGTTRVARDKRRLYDQANDLMRRAYEHELSVLRARRQALEHE
jgi:hypothetical protein